MSEHKATIIWNRTNPEFTAGKYSRQHTWTFDGGITIPASASPSVVPPPWSNPAYVDPEEAFVAAVSSCHMLTFLHLASQQGFLVDSYHDEAIGMMSLNERGVPWVGLIRLRPQITYSGDKRPTPSDEQHLHHLAHDKCFIANSIDSKIEVEGIGG